MFVPCENDAGFKQATNTKKKRHVISSAVMHDKLLERAKAKMPNNIPCLNAFSPNLN